MPIFKKKDKKEGKREVNSPFAPSLPQTNQIPQSIQRAQSRPTTPRSDSFSATRNDSNEEIPPADILNQQFSVVLVIILRIPSAFEMNLQMYWNNVSIIFYVSIINRKSWQSPREYVFREFDLSFHLFIYCFIFVYSLFLLDWWICLLIRKGKLCWQWLLIENGNSSNRTDPNPLELGEGHPLSPMWVLSTCNQIISTKNIFVGIFDRDRVPRWKNWIQTTHSISPFLRDAYNRNPIHHTNLNLPSSSSNDSHNNRQTIY